MPLSRTLETLSRYVRTLNPRASLPSLTRLPALSRGAAIARQWGPPANSGTLEHSPAVRGEHDYGNPLQAHIDGVKEGPGVWKWLHYFELYHRHLHKFVRREASVVEIGVYSGGSLQMWRRYFGERCRIHGVAIQEDCKTYEDSSTTIHIGNHADRRFWKQFRASLPAVDVLIDDGGHKPEQQMVTLEEMLPHLRPGGVYICEDIHGAGNPFTAFAHALAAELNAFAHLRQHHELASTATPFQAAVDLVHMYPFVVVIEKRSAMLRTFSAQKHGIKWQPLKPTVISGGLGPQRDVCPRTVCLVERRGPA
jgi:Methyltransferase domain